MADPQDRAAEVREQILQLQLEVPLQKAVERGKRLVEQNDARLGAEDARQCRALLLPARKLGGVLPLQPLQMETPELLGRLTLLLRAAAGADAALDVLHHTHVGKQRVLLEEIAHPPLLRRKVDALFAVEQCFAVEHDAPPVRRHDARDALERHALAAARRAEQRHRAACRLKARAEREAAELFLDISDQAHALLLPRPAAASRFFFSSMLTTSRITAEIATFTSTHLSASSSLLICQS